VSIAELQAASWSPTTIARFGRSGLRAVDDDAVRGGCHQVLAARVQLDRVTVSRAVSLPD